MRDGTYCQFCGYELFNWQEDEFDVFPGMCPECSLEAMDFGLDEDDFVDYLEAW